MNQESKLSETKRKEIIETLEMAAEIERRKKADPLRFVKEHPKQIEASSINKMIRALFWGNRCLAKGTSVLMANGESKNIEDIKVGDYVSAFDHNKKNCVPSLVTRTTGEYIEESYHIKFSTGEIKVGHTHPILISSRTGKFKWVKAEDLKLGDMVITPKGMFNKKKGIINKNIISIKKIGELPCYDITINHPDHSFIANEIVVSNCGKTEWGAMEAARILLGRHPFIPQGEIWSACPSYDAQEETTQKKLLTYLPKDRILDISYLRKNIIKTIFVRADDGRATKITFKSYEQGREKFQGAGKVLIWFDEEPPKDIYDECFVRQDAGQKLWIILTMTPIKGMTWVYNNLYLNTSSPDIFISKAGWKDNPFLTQEQIDLMSRNLTEAALKVRRDGDFVKMVGLVCGWFSRATHIVDMKDNLPPGDTYLGIDFGFSDPTSGLYIRIDREFNLWIFDGFYRRGMTNPDIQKIIKLKETGINGRIIRVGDSAQASDIKQLNDAGIAITGVSKTSGDSKESWDQWRAQKMEEYGRIQLSNQKPKIFISKDLIEVNDNGEPFNFLVSELENLLWEIIKVNGDQEQKPIWGRQAKHAIDALSYIIATMVKPLEQNNKYKQREIEPISEFMGN